MGKVDFRAFLRLQSDSWLAALKVKVEDALTANSEFTSMAMGGKSMGRQREVKTAELAQQLAGVLIERGLQGSDYAAPDRMTIARFA